MEWSHTTHANRRVELERSTVPMGASAPETQLVGMRYVAVW